MITTKHQHIKFTLSVLLLASLILALLTPAEAKAAQHRQVAKTESYTVSANCELSQTVNDYVDNDYSSVSDIFEFWGNDGDYRVAYSDGKKVYIDVLGEGFVRKQTVTIKKSMSNVGNVCMDKEGNYYIVFGEPDLEEKRNIPVMRVAKYDRNGVELGRVDYVGDEMTGPYAGDGWGTREPFAFANCDTVIDSNGILAARYGRVMYNGHQSSHIVYVDTRTMQKIDGIYPYTSHSFNQKIIETSDGGYLLAERGDAFNRGITISKIDRQSNYDWNSEAFVPFHFTSGSIYQKTYATIGGIAELSNGYALAGTSVKTLSCKAPKSGEDKMPRNLFLQVFSKSFSYIDVSNPEVHLLNGEERIPTDTEYSEEHGCSAYDVDYGVLWLTDYSGTEYASVPKMIKLDSERMLLMWEKKDFDYEKKHKNDVTNQGEFVDTYYCIVSCTGELLLDVTPIGKLRLSEDTAPTYKDGCVYWTTTVGELGSYKSTKYEIHKLVVGETMNEPIAVEKIQAPKKQYVELGKTAKIKASVKPGDAAVKDLEFQKESYIDEFSLAGSGKVKGLKHGYGEVTIVSKDNPLIKKEVTIYVTYPTVKNLKAKVVEGKRIKLTWKDKSGCPYYIVCRSTSKNGKYKEIGIADGKYFTDYDKLKSGKTYYYKIMSRDDCLEGDYKSSKPVKVKAK